MPITGRLYVAGVLAAFFICVDARAEDQSLLDRVGSVFDTITESLKRVGEKSEELLEPRIGPLKDVAIMDFTGRATARRPVERSLPVASDVVVAISSEFGRIRVEGWDQAIAQIRAEISAGANTEDEAQAVAEKIDVKIDAEASRVAVQTMYPPPHELGRTPVTVDYILNIPRTASLLCRNSFGDVAVTGIDGSVTIDLRYGVLDASNLGGNVSIQARGDMPVTVAAVSNGANISVQRAPLLLRNTAGKVNVSSFAAPVELRDLPINCDMDVAAENADIRLFYKPGEMPNVHAEAFFATVQADGVEVTELNNVSIAKHTVEGSARVVRLQSTFNPISITQETSDQGTAAPLPPPADEIVQGQLGERSYPVSEGAEVTVDAMIGDVEIIGWDEDRLVVSATQSAHMLSMERAAEAIESLAMTVDTSPAAIGIKTQAVGDMTVLGCTAYRIDLKVSCPRTSPVRVRAESGKTVVSGLAGPVTVVQQEGTLNASHVKGLLELTNHRGDIVADNAGGPVTASTLQGGVSTSNIYGGQTIAANGGKIVVDAPKGTVKATNMGADIRMIALDGIYGNTELTTERGNVSMVVAPTADASFIVNVENGSVVPSFQLSGSVTRNVQIYQGALNGGLHRVDIRVKDGKVVID